MFSSTPHSPSPSCFVFNPLDPSPNLRRRRLLRDRAAQQRPPYFLIFPGRTLVPPAQPLRQRSCPCSSRVRAIPASCLRANSASRKRRFGSPSGILTYPLRFRWHLVCHFRAPSRQRCCHSGCISQYAHLHTRSAPRTTNPEYPHKRVRALPRSASTSASLLSFMFRLRRRCPVSPRSL